MTNLLKIKEIFSIESHINHSNKNININEVFHHHNHRPLSFVFNVVGSSENFHAELLQTFNDNNSIWIITEYFNELKNEGLDHSLNARTALIKIMQKKRALNYYY